MSEHPTHPSETGDHDRAASPTAAAAPVASAEPAAPSRRRSRPGRSAWVLVLAFGLTAGGGAAVGALAERSTTSSAGATSITVPGQRGGSSSGGRGGSSSGGFPGGGAQGGSSGGSGSTGSGTSTSSGTTATAAQQVGVVTIDTVLGYADGEAAGTGIVLSSKGEILTNNHVVSGATSIKVTVETTGTTYTAKVVGTDATDDVAVLQLVGASGLKTATIDDDGVTTGQAVTAVGNAGGTGTLLAAVGTITATGQSITTEAEGTAAAERLTNLLQVDADIVSGDSGGPLLDSEGEVVGIDTAASSGTSDVTGFAIPIKTALTIAAKIQAGTETSTITIGLPAFLGVELSSLSGASTSGAVVAGIEEDTPAAQAGLAAGDTITALDSTPIASADALSAALAAHEPGDSVTLTWTDTSGSSHQAKVTLIEGPAA